MDISNLIPNTEKGQPLGVATLDITGKVPSAQLPAKPGNFLPIAGGTMTGTLNMGSKDIVSAQSIDSGLILSNNLRGRTNTTNPILIENPINMNAKKITNAAKGTANGDVVTVENINDHDTSPFAHANIRNLISAIQGAYIYRGVINENTINVTQINLNARILVLMGRAAILGDVLTDLDRTDWYFDGASWDNMGQTFVVLASAVNDGLMSKEDYTKLFDLYTKAQLDAKFELLANKAVDWSVINNDKYPTTKAVAEMLLNMPIAELNNHTLREVFEGGQLFINSDLTSLTNWSTLGTIHTLSGGKVTFNGDGTSTRGALYQSVVGINGNKYYLGSYVSSNITNTSIGLLYYGNQLGGIKNIDKISTEKWNSVIVTWATGYNNNAFAIDWRDGTLLTGNYVTVRKPLLLNLTSLDISALTVERMDYWFNVYQSLQVSSANALFTLYAPKQQEAWLTPTLTSATTTYLKYRKDNFGVVAIEGNITITTAGTNFTLPTGYRPLFAYTVGILTFNTNGTVVSSTTGTQTLSVRFTGGA